MTEKPLSRLAKRFKPSPIEQRHAKLSYTSLYKGRVERRRKYALSKAYFRIIEEKSATSGAEIGAAYSTRFMPDLGGVLEANYDLRMPAILETHKTMLELALPVPEADASSRCRPPQRA